MEESLGMLLEADFYFIYCASSTGTGLEHVQEEAGCSKTEIITFTLTGGENISDCNITRRISCYGN